MLATLEVDVAPWDIGGGFAPLEGCSYNGQTPGPTIEAHQGGTLVVRLTNRLNEPTTLHWHGLPLHPTMDRTQDVPQAVEPGATFEYRVTLLDAGTYWYHPRETAQRERGAYGALIVHGADEPTVDADRVLVFDDVTLDRRGHLARPGGWRERHDGRQGRVGLLNGRVRPSFQIAAGQVERWRLINVATGRAMRFSIGSARVRVIGTHGGLLDTAVEADAPRLASADRMDILVGPFQQGQVLDIQARDCAGGLSHETAAIVLGSVIVGPARSSRGG